MSAEHLLGSFAIEDGHFTAPSQRLETVMTLMLLHTHVMLNLSDAWIDPRHDRSVLEAWPRGQLLLPHIEAAHGRLFAAAARPDTASITERQAASAEADLTFARKARSVWHCLTGAAEGVDDPALRARILSTRKKLLPRGLDVVRWSYGAEGAAAGLLADRLASVDAEVLREVTAWRGVTVEALVRQWIDAGLALTELEAARRAAGGKPPRGLRAARAAWVKVARQIERDAAFDGLDTATTEALLGPLQRASQKVRAKIAAKRGAK